LDTAGTDLLALSLIVIDFHEFSGYPENDALMAVILFSEAWYPIRCVG
jgi:hypothetical protein